METRISSKGQITLPVAVRKKLGIKTGDVLRVKIGEDGKVILDISTRDGKNDKKAAEILRATAGIWKDMKESGENFVRRLREEDSKRWRVLELE